MFQYLIIAALSAALGFGAYDRWQLVSKERHACTLKLIEEVDAINKESMDQIAQAKRLGDDFVLPADLNSLCKSDRYCRDR